MVPGLLDGLAPPSHPTEALQRHIAGNFNTYHTTCVLSTCSPTANLLPN